MLQANVSTEEYSRMYQVYLQSVHQTEAMRDLRYWVNIITFLFRYRNQLFRNHFSKHLEEPQRKKTKVLKSLRNKYTDSGGNFSLFQIDDKQLTFIIPFNLVAS